MSLLLLPSILANSQRPHQPLLLLQSSASQSCLLILRDIINHEVSKGTSKRIHTLLFCFLHPPSSLAENASLTSEGGMIEVFDHTAKVPGYDDSWVNPCENILASVRAAPAGPLEVIIDSVDSLASDIGSDSQTYKFLHTLTSLIRVRPNPSRLILHLLHPSPLIPLLTQTSFSPTLIRIVSHPPILLRHLSTAYLTLPPPLSPPEKFWGVFIPISERGYESEKLVFGSEGEGPGGGKGELVVEVLVRGGGEGRRRAVERTLEGWSHAKGGAVDLASLGCLQSLWARKVTDQAPPADPTQNVSFNLNLTPSQIQSRAQVPLPYAHEGKPIEKQTASSAILYDPDSADDIDDDDPDDDLDI